MDRDHIYQVYRSLLRRLEGGENIPVEGRFLTIEDVFSNTFVMVATKHFCPCHVLEMLQVASRAITAQHTGDNTTSVIQELTHLGMLTLRLVSNYVIFEQCPVAGKWERVALVATSLVSYWRPGLDMEVRLLDGYCKQWTVTAMRCRIRCPNPVVRLHMLHFLAMWDLEDMIAEDLGPDAAFAVIENALDLTLPHLLPKGRVGLVLPLRKVLQNMQVSGFLGAFVLSSVFHIKQLVVGNVERTLTYLVVLMGKAARRVLQLRRGGDLTPVGAVEQLMNILHILHLFMATPPNQELFEEPGMCQIAASAIAKTCKSIVQVPDAPEARQRYARLVQEVNDFFGSLAVFQIKDTLLQELRRYHGRCLSYVAAKMKEVGCSASNIPAPLEETQQAPPKSFLDGRTGRLMERPVKLLLTGQVVDRSTLLLLKLATIVDPRTGVAVDGWPCELMPSLREEIQAWRQQQEHS